jgi:hypothetical protein
VRTGGINLFLIYTFGIQNAHKVETREIFQDEKYFSPNAQPPSALPVTRLTYYVTFTPQGTSCISYSQSSSLNSCAKFGIWEKSGTLPLLNTKIR